ncbi:MAG: ComF family protein [Betaproteobacteria bacterium]|nr:ComF family protein [Betaproteobacteria bacterium]
MTPGSLGLRIAAIAFGGSCYLCRGAAGRGALICADCEGDLARLPPECCPRCALPSPGKRVCGRCLAHPPGFDATVAALAYAFPADALVKALKFGSQFALASLLAQRLAEAIEGSEPVDVMLPVPLHARRLTERGYNQSVEIARALAHRIGAPLVTSGCERLRDTPSQTELPLDARRRNMHSAFACSLPLAGRRVALVDDVMTTGATLDSLALAVKRAGAERVVNWVVARAL